MPAMRYLIVGTVLAAWPALAAASRADDVDFNRDVRPILSRNCFACHGPDAAHREADLRLDVRDVAVAPLPSGNRAIVPGDADASALVQRVGAADDALRMPPPQTGKRLSAAEIATLRRWVAQGAPYAPHWSLVAPVRPPLPSVVQASWCRSPLDRFVLAAMQAQGFAPSPEADRYTLIRRLSLDLRGLPPTPQEVEAFVADTRPDAYERLVDRFLADPAYGERWARVWLDLARYADSAGYGSDPLRTIWRYRDWVIAALNANMPYDQFTIEQLAGDLLPGATLEQQVATAFHRNTMTNTEGGTDDEEFRVAAVKDRVDTTLQVWMGLTMGCAKCHNHKYDPITQREYYEFFAFFNQTADADRNDESPTIAAPTPEVLARQAEIDRRLAELRQRLASLPAPQAAPTANVQFVRIELPGKDRILSLAEVQVLDASGTNIAPRGVARQSSTAFDGPAKLAIDGVTDGHYFNARSTTHTQIESDPWWELDLQSEQAVARVVIWNRTDGNLQQRLSAARLLLLDGQRKPVLQTVLTEVPNPSREIAAGEDPARRALQEEIAALQRSRPAAPTVPVMQELPPSTRRKTYVLDKGNFLLPREEVQGGVPAALHPWPEAAPPNRLGVAQWLVDRRNPLTARVAVNRLWGHIFGTGLVETQEDFGSQGELPSHPELLDWLAVEFMDRHWDTKHLLRLLVTSATYRQASHVTDEHRRRDPHNRLLTRGPRYRLEAEAVRDQALALSGLLSRKMYGPSVFPPQPDGLWQAAFNGRDRRWPTSSGEDRYRRGLYTFWRRTVPYPSMATFDAPSREVCAVRRVRTNTPLQAFVTLNDPVYVEAAQALARRLIHEGGSTPQQRAAYGLELCLARPASPQHVAVLVELYTSEFAHYSGDLAAAQRLATDPLGPLPPDASPAEAAAWTVVANVLLNLDAVLGQR
jgi:hypothetical protein